MRTDAWADGALAEIEAAVRATVKRIGYEQSGFHWNEFTFENNLHGQSAEIAMGVDEGSNKDEGAGDQGIMFGYRLTRRRPDAGDALLQPQDPGTMAGDRHRGSRRSWSPTPRARSRCAMRTASRSARPRSSCRRSTRGLCLGDERRAVWCAL